MAIVYIPPPLRELTGGIEEVRAPGATIRELIQSLDALHPGVAARLLSAGRLNPGISVAINGVLSNQGLIAAVPPDAEVHFLPAISGG